MLSVEVTALFIQFMHVVRSALRSLALEKACAAAHGDAAAEAAAIKAAMAHFEFVFAHANGVLTADEFRTTLKSCMLTYAGLNVGVSQWRSFFESVSQQLLQNSAVKARMLVDSGASMRAVLGQPGAHILCGQRAQQAFTAQSRHSTTAALESYGEMTDIGHSGQQHNWGVAVAAVLHEALGLHTSAQVQYTVDPAGEYHAIGFLCITIMINDKVDEELSEQCQQGIVCKGMLSLLKTIDWMQLSKCATQRY